MSDIRETADITERLKFDNPILGFYHEGRLGPAPPIPSEVVYVSGEKRGGRNTFSNKKEMGLVMLKYTNQKGFLVDAYEARDFYKLTDDKIDVMFESVEIPDGFNEWYEECKLELQDH